MGIFGFATQALGLGDIGSSVDDFLVNNSGDLLKAGAGVAGAGASIYAANQQANASRDAANVNADASREANANARYFYDQSRADYAPYREIGTQALGSLAGLAGGGFSTSPDYNFRLGEGLNALDRSMSARGLLESGAGAKAALSYGQGLASNEYDKYWNRIASLAGIGQTATGGTSAAGSDASRQIGGALQNEGAARASGYTGSASAINGGLNNLTTLAYLYGGRGGGGGAVSPWSSGGYTDPWASGGYGT